MTIYTPGGMPINVPMNYAFTLLARLYPKYRPHKVLKIAEGMDKAPEAVAYLLAFILFALRFSSAIIFISIFVIPAILRYKQIRSKYIDLVVNLGVIFSTIGHFGIISIGLAVFGYYSVGWQGLVAFLGARVLGGVINTILEAQEKNRIRVVAGVWYNEFDRCFVDAYRFCANKIGVTLDPSASEGEIESNRWKIFYIDYSQQNPILFKVKQFS
ncbi:hypothetical protein BV372_33975 [Nostoc sp. T09]|uniref:hypothetical protein n=1 Tax=Nostoc sp. T09 TaxID=1932621 RepID=UPI000A3CF85B|nr:hypothetical protein [Nostoc sp. T09]OUL18759.1 hypothetical protein BV372_33975 [Nostoc sp. T09]